MKGQKELKRRKEREREREKMRDKRVEDLEMESRKKRDEIGRIPRSSAEKWKNRTKEDRAGDYNNINKQMNLEAGEFIDQSAFVGGC